MKALKLRGQVYYLQAQNPQKRKQDEISLKTRDRNTAITRRNRFLLTLKETGSWEAARSELLGKGAIRKGESPTFEQMVELYREFNLQSAKTIRPISFDTNVRSFRRLMTRLKAQTVNDLDFDHFKFTPENRKKVCGEIRHAKGMFKPAALRFYAKKGVKIENPFKGVELDKISFEPYRPLPQSIRDAILAGIEDLPSDQALAVILALKLGLRKSEADRSRLSWITQERGGKFLFTVGDEEDFKPKTPHSRRSIPIPKNLVQEILRIRKKGNPSADDPYIIAGKGQGATRKDRTFRAVNQWLKAKGVESVNPFHSLRKEFVSFLVTNHGAGVAFKLAGHSDMNLVMQVYGGLTKPPVIDYK